MDQETKEEFVKEIQKGTFVYITDFCNANLKSAVQVKSTTDDQYYAGRAQAFAEMIQFLEILKRGGPGGQS